MAGDDKEGVNTRVLGSLKFPPGVLEGLVDVTSPDLVFEKPKPVALDLGEAAMKLFVPEAVETGARADGHEPGENVIPFHADDGIFEAAELLADIKQMSAEMQSQLSGAKAELEQYISSTRGAGGAGAKPDLKHIGDLVSKARSEEATKESMTPQQRMDKLWQEMKADKEIADKALESVSMSKAEMEEKKKLDEALRAAEESGDPDRINNAWKEQARFLAKMGKKYNLKEVEEAGQRIERKTEEQTQNILDVRYQRSAELPVQQPGDALLTDARARTALLNKNNPFGLPSQDRLPASETDRSQAAQLASPNTPDKTSKSAAASVGDAM